jgi:hypothetical protein
VHNYCTSQQEYKHNIIIDETPPPKPARLSKSLDKASPPPPPSNKTISLYEDMDDIDETKS